MASSTFSSVPILDYSLLASPSTRADFIAQLRHALINVGFLYLSHPPVARTDIDAVIDYAPRLFALPQTAKNAIRMANSEHFFGYSRLGAEITKGKTDQREQFDFATPYENRWSPGEPEYLRLWGPVQWPDEDLLPGFKDTMLRYLAQVERLSYEFSGLIAEAFGLPAEMMQSFYKGDAPIQHRAKVVKYPPLDDGLASNQGVGPHYDGGFLTFLLQASPHPGLQVQNLAGEWIDAPPIPGTFVINIGKALETATQGLARATSHRVLSPPKGSTPRYSIPFFQNIAQRLSLKDIQLQFSPEILKLKEDRGEVGTTDSVNYSEYDRLPVGLVNLIGRVKSHPDVAERHYPDLFKQFFPQGMPLQGSAY
ncbi:Clavaminate synthase-like protein [Laetiporus sulphureus 93-53]|uniref:Clavaminate synthase-like protein n=1 Tax=Laetiporus sulphureus 93-53 TaxID=1314785 RepID=A0A165GN64_9APHY|nr:Clavaminate synthase-like protein [Laetiporus sulphureus 93-53]KZT10577.1 Clavaminate synthase-like protein [Laetiporus sulphureus 93-53]